MVAWRCFFLNRSGQVGSIEQMDGTLDGAEALHLCRLMLLSTGSYDAFELWQGARRVHAELRHAVAS